MAKMGTTTATGNAMKAATNSGVRHGASQKNTNATRKAAPVVGKGAAGATKPIKGMNRGGV